LGNEA
jgi:hypothetical protein